MGTTVKGGETEHLQRKDIRLEEFSLFIHHVFFQSVLSVRFQASSLLIGP